MENYVELATVYGDRERELNLDFLGSRYADREYLKEKVAGLMKGHVEAEDVAGKSVLLKPNWVRHNLVETDKLCLCTHENLILAAAEYFLAMKPSKMLIADAPVQGCKWELLLTDRFKAEVAALQERYGVSVGIKDFRRTVYDRAHNRVETDRVSMDDYVIFDVGGRSYLEDISTEENRFRITNYNPDKMATVHHRGMHKYCIAKDFFDYDIVVTMPKMKTHQKAGFTNSLKILVGINGDKDFLPHHRMGAADNGGDCYARKSLWRTIAERSLDQANRHIGAPSYYFYHAIVKVCWKLSRTRGGQDLSAGWYGNDTIWRTVMDINQIACYGRVGDDGQGVLEEVPQRRLLTLCDAIVGGQGNGPLHPDPLPLGILAFSDNPYWMDTVGGQLLGLKLEKIPLLREAKRIAESSPRSLRLNGESVDESALSTLSVCAAMPPGWVDYLSADCVNV